MRRQVEAKGASLEVFLDGSGPVIVLLPSFGRGADDFDALVPDLVAAGYTAVRPQPRGAGNSRGGMQNLTYLDWAGDIASVIEEITDGPAIVLGHAAGNRFARVCAATRPDLIRGVVIAATSALGPAPDVLGAALMTASDVRAPVEARLAALRLAFFAPGADPTPWLDGWYAATGLALRNTEPTPDWTHPGAVAVLDLQAEFDPWRPVSTRTELTSLLGAGQVTVQVVRGASHALLPERPREVVHAVTSWAGALPPTHFGGGVRDDNPAA